LKKLRGLLINQLWIRYNIYPVGGSEIINQSQHEKSLMFRAILFIGFLEKAQIGETFYHFFTT